MNPAQVGADQDSRRPDLPARWVGPLHYV